MEVAYQKASLKRLLQVNVDVIGLCKLCSQHLVYCSVSQVEDFLESLARS